MSVRVVVVVVVMVVAASVGFFAEGFVLTPDHVTTATVALPAAVSHVLTQLHVPSSLSMDVLAPTLTPVIREGEKLIVEDVGGAYETLKNAMVPAKFSNAAASILAESAAGAVGALISRGTANVLGDKKKDTLGTKLSTTGVYFGARQVAVTCLNRFVGVPRPLALLLAALLSSVIKIERRATEAAAIEQEREDAARRGYYCLDGDVIINMSPPAAPSSTPLPSSLSSATTAAVSDSATVAAPSRPHRFQMPGRPRLPTHLRPRSSLSTNSPPAAATSAAAAAAVKPPSDTAPRPRAAAAVAPSVPSPPPAPPMPVPLPPTRRRIVSLPEVLGDVSKWMVFDALAVNQDLAARTVALTGVELNVLYFLFGTTAAVTGKLVYDLAEAAARRNATDTSAAEVGAEVAPRRSTTSAREVRTRETVRYGSAAVEGGVLFGTYEAALSAIQQDLPADWNKEFLFEELLEQLECVVRDAVVVP
jgi:hypothetical protein